ncbi:hypothetical protein PRK78_005867 [Emydomyces testavorans]|uniref:Tetratricopeptide repeat and J domain-containing co-chaperone DNJ1 n=1 Tax=Emydomyces testavorans TaxID=2070801 RepID=A0AAF0DMH9_9EURO|nr:hypothetical protein PRK78_005867 [Emydomyces testavorans]
MIVGLQSVTFLLAIISAANNIQASEIPSDLPVASLISTAKTHLANGSPRDALLYFDAAISKDPTNYLTIFQRGATYLSLGRSSKAIEDFDRVLKLKPGFEGALMQRARIRTKSADWAGAKRDLEAAGNLGRAELEEMREAEKAAIASEKAEKQGDWESCVSQTGAAILKAGASLPLRQRRARCRFERGEIQEGISDLAHVLQISPGSVRPHLEISAMLFYSLADTDRGIAQIRKCLHSDPDSKVCSRLFRREKQISKLLQRLNTLMEQRKFSKAVELLVGSKEESGLIDDVKEEVKSARADGYIHKNAPDRLYADLIEKTCEAYREMNAKRKAKPFCSEALTFNPSSLHGLLSKAEGQIDSGEYEAAIQTLGVANESHPGFQPVQALHQKAQMLLKRSKQKDYYKVLGVDRDADDATIKRAYRKLTKQNHPDKVRSQGVSKEDAEKKMAAINEAYEVLSNPELRARFDRGEDPNNPESQQGHPFQGSPFGPGGGGQQFFFHQGAGGPQFKFSQQGFNFPGGFQFG